MLITETILYNGMSRNGGWSLKQLKLLGVDDLVKGWKRRIIGTHVSQSNIERFLALKDAHLPKLLSPTYYI
jgi:hypothetical protein